MASSLSGTDVCFLSMACKNARGAFGPENQTPRKTISAKQVILGHGVSKALALGCPLASAVTEILAEVGGDVELVLARKLGCPVGPRVVAEAITRNKMHMMIWAFKSGATIPNDAVVKASGGSSPHMIKWLVRNGYDMKNALFRMSARGNTGGVKELNNYYNFDARTWGLALMAAVEGRRADTAEWIREVPLAPYMPCGP